MPSTRDFQPDAIVVGTGPGGATVARELTRRGLRVLILERGGRAPITGSLLRFTREAGMPGRGLLRSGGVGVVRALATGGSSLYYFGTAWEPPYALFDRHGVDLREAVAEVRADLPVAPLTEELIGPAAGRLRTAARELGYAWAPLPKLLRQDALARGEAPAGFHAAPVGAKWTAREFVDEARAGGAELRIGVTVRRVLLAGGRATGVEDARGRRYHAPLVVMASGGIGSAAILRRSGVAGAGRRLFHDPLRIVLGTAPNVRRGPEIPMTAGVNLAQEGIALTDYSAPRPFEAQLALQARALGVLARPGRTLGIMVKVRDDLAGEVTARGRLRKPLTAADRAKLDAGCARAEEILRAAGVARPRRSGLWAAHPGGSVRIGEVVDRDLATAHRGLYVCDASVIPEPWGLPPTMTIVALAKRLAAHLAGAPRRAEELEVAR